MNIIILNGPTGTGKNTIASKVANKLERCAVIDYDVIHQMFFKPHKTPWDGEEGRKQNILGLDHVRLLAESFVADNYNVLILDVLNDETAELYKEKLKKLNPKLVFLLPTFEEIIIRNNSRPPRLTPDELKMVYEQQSQLSVCDVKIDNTKMSAEEVSDKILELIVN